MARAETMPTSSGNTPIPLEERGLDGMPKDFSVDVIWAQGITGRHLGLPPHPTQPANPPHAPQHIQGFFDIFEEIARGSFGVVMAGRHLMTGTPSSVKIVRREKVGEGYADIHIKRDMFNRLLRFSSDWRHPNVTQYLDFMMGPAAIFIIMEALTGEDLFDHLQRCAPGVTVAKCWRVMRHLLSALEQVHKCGIVHRDVKIDNIRLRSSDPEADFVLFDFGHCCFAGVEERKDVVGTPAFMAPEVFSRSYDTQIDLWSAGVVLYIMMTGTLPFPPEAAAPARPGPLGVEEEPQGLGAPESDIVYLWSRGLIGRGLGLPPEPAQVRNPSKAIRTISDAYDQGDEIGRGSFGTVKASIHRASGTRCVVKSVPKNKVGSRYFENHVSGSWRFLQFSREGEAPHPNVIRYLDCLIAPASTLYVVMEELGGQELFDHLQRHAPVTSGFCRRVMRHLLSALEHIHSRGVVHRDVKPDSLRFRDRSPAADLVLFDFGHSCSVLPTGAADSTESVGTPTYMAPEAYSRGGACGTPLDAWSAGVVLYIMLTGLPPPWGCVCPGAEAVQLALGGAELEVAPRAAVDVLGGLLRRDPEGRLTAPAALQHAWFTSGSADSDLDAAPADRLIQVQPGAYLATRTAIEHTTRMGLQTLATAQFQSRALAHQSTEALREEHERLRWQRCSTEALREEVMAAGGGGAAGQACAPPLAPQRAAQARPAPKSPVTAEVLRNAFENDQVRSLCSKVPGAIDLVKGVLVLDPGQRLTARQALLGEWMSADVSSAEVGRHTLQVGKGAYQTVQMTIEFAQQNIPSRLSATKERHMMSMRLDDSCFGEAPTRSTPRSSQTTPYGANMPGILRMGSTYAMREELEMAACGSASANLPAPGAAFYCMPPGLSLPENTPIGGPAQARRVVFEFVVPRRKLESKEHLVVSDSFYVDTGSIQTPFRLRVAATKVHNKRLGHCFRKAGGRGRLELKCDRPPEPQDGVPPLTFRFYVGSGSHTESRGPVMHDFGASSSVGGLPPEMEEWDFKAAVDPTTESCPIGVEIMLDAP